MEIRSEPIAERIEGTTRTGTSGVGGPHVFLRLDGLSTLVAATIVYRTVGGRWSLFALLFLAPDLSMVGYLAGPRIGAIAYNLFHGILLPVTVVIFGVVSSYQLAIHIGLVWLAHIGLDRAIGYGFKYPTAFRDTHFQRV